MMLQNPIRRVAMLVLAAALAVLLVPGLVLAHAELETPTPADKALVDPPVTEVSGIYSEAMKPTGSSLIVKNTSGAAVASGTVDPEDDTRMVATPATPLGTGTYTVEWTSVALDDHVERGTWTFTVGVAAPAVSSPPPTVAPSATPSAAATAVQATPLPSVAPTPVPSADGSSTGIGSDVLLPIIVALIILGAGAAYLLSRRNRPTDPTDPT
jgi:methionine-rich copper-binding protein CopC